MCERRRVFAVLDSRVIRVTQTVESAERAGQPTHLDSRAALIYTAVREQHPRPHHKGAGAPPLCKHKRRRFGKVGFKLATDSIQFCSKYIYETVTKRGAHKSWHDLLLLNDKNVYGAASMRTHPAVR